jgi:hypothetical protein
MPQRVPEQLSKTIETLYRSESGRILATLVHLLGDLDLAEEAMHEAFAAALDTWRQTGIPLAHRLETRSRYEPGRGGRLQPPENALTLYWKNGKVATSDGPYAEPKNSSEAF